MNINFFAVHFAAKSTATLCAQNLGTHLYPTIFVGASVVIPSSRLLKPAAPVSYCMVKRCAAGLVKVLFRNFKDNITNETETSSRIYI